MHTAGGAVALTSHQTGPNIGNEVAFCFFLTKERLLLDEDVPEA
jgi:hypothetical protein